MIRQIELLSAPDAPVEPRSADVRTRPRRNYRAWLFIVTWVVTTSAGLAYTFLRAPIYASNATLLIEPPESSARPLRNGAAGTTVNVTAPVAANNAQYLATEQQRLMSETVLHKAADMLEPLLVQPGSAVPALTVLQQTVKASYAADTNLIELKAEGEEKALLPAILSGWIDAYLSSRAEIDTSARASVNDQLETQLAELDSRIKEARADIERFRRQHGIVSDDRTENRDLAKLRGLNDAINRAQEEELKAVANLDAIRAAVAAGLPVTQGREKAAIERLDARVMELREQVRAYEEQYTDKYIALAPEIAAVRKNLAKAEEELEARKREATADVIAEAERAVASARDNTARLMERQAALKSTIAEFSSRYQELQSKKQALEQLEEQAAALRERQVRTEVGEAELQASVTLLQQPTTPGMPVRPDYVRDSGIAAGGGFLLALLTALLYDFLRRTPEAMPMPPAGERPANIYSYSTQVFPGPAHAPTLDYEPAPAPARTLPSQLPRELSPQEVAALLNADDPGALALAGLLLCGLSFEEVAGLDWSQFEQGGLVLRTAPPASRVLSVPTAVRAALLRLAGGQPPAEGPVWRSPAGTVLEPGELAAQLTYVAHDAGIARPVEVTPEALRHTYLAFLVRQGVKLAEVRRVAGFVSPTVLASLASLSYPGAGRALEEVETVYPGLEAA